MAITKRRKATSTARKKPSAAKKRKAKVSEAPDKIKIGGLNFTKSSCHTRKGDAVTRAENVRSKGRRARVLKSGNSFCVFTGGVSKVLKSRARS